MGKSVTPNEAIDLLDSAEALRAADQSAEAIAQLERALRVEGPLDASLEAEIRLRLADCHSGLNQHESAQRAVEPMLRADVSEPWHARARVRLARSHYYRGDVETSIELSREALHVLERSSLHAETAMALQWLGDALQESGDNARAYDTFRDAVTLSRMSEDRVRHASCLGSLARIEVQRSRYREARRLFTECLALAEAAGHRKDVARTNLNLSVCSFYLGRWEQSKREAELALRLYRELGDDRGKALCKLALCRLARRSGENPRALLKEAAELADRSGYRRARLLVIEERGDIARDRGNLEQATDLYEKLLQLAGPEAPGGDISYEVRWRLALVRLDSGEETDAERLARRALEDATRASDRREAALCRMALARILHRRDRAEEAGEEIRAAVRAFERLDIPFELAEALEVAARIVPLEEQLTHHEEARRIRQKLGIESPRPAAVEDPDRGIVAVDRSTRRLIESTPRLASLRKPILLRGETGVGKTLYAKLIHDSGPSATGELIVLDCASWSERRVESGRATDPIDFVALGKQGTLILDNIDGASSTLQRLLVGAIDNGHDAHAGRLHVISTTTEDLESLARQGRFSKDLYYRLAGIVVHVPPLRERKQDLASLAEVFSKQELPPESLEILLGHPWPGNVTELRNVIDSAALLAGDGPIAPQHLPECLRREPGKARTLPGRIAVLERREIRAALGRTGNNKRAAARELGISRKGLIDRLKRLNMWAEYGRNG